MVWRVRLWIRLIAVAVGAVLVVLGRYGNTTQYWGGDPGGWAGFLIVYAALVWLLAFRPRLELDDDGWVTMRNPLGVHRFQAKEVRGFGFATLGLAVQLASGFRPVTWIFQDTMA